jgi:hypothetical protein
MSHLNGANIIANAFTAYAVLRTRPSVHSSVFQTLHAVLSRATIVRSGPPIPQCCYHPSRAQHQDICLRESNDRVRSGTMTCTTFSNASHVTYPLYVPCSVIQTSIHMPPNVKAPLICTVIGPLHIRLFHFRLHEALGTSSHSWGLCTHTLLRQI